MMAHIKISACDGECAAHNGCTIGGIECRGCHTMFCAYEIGSDGLCPDCAEEAEKDARKEAAK